MSTIQEKLRKLREKERQADFENARPNTVAGQKRDPITDSLYPEKRTQEDDDADFKRDMQRMLETSLSLGGNGVVRDVPYMRKPFGEAPNPALKNRHIAPPSDIAEGYKAPPPASSRKVVEKPSTIPSKPQPEPPSQQAWDNRQQAFERAKEIVKRRDAAGDMPDKEVLDYRKRAYDATKKREEFNNRPQEGGTTVTEPRSRTSYQPKESTPVKKSGLDQVPEGYRLTTRQMLEIERKYKAKLAEKAKAVRESKKTDLEKSMQGLPRVRKSNMDMAEISDPNVPEPVKIRDVKKYNDRGEKVKQGIRKRKQE